MLINGRRPFGPRRLEADPREVHRCAHFTRQSSCLQLSSRIYQGVYHYRNHYCSVEVVRSMPTEESSTLNLWVADANAVMDVRFLEPNAQLELLSCSPRRVTVASHTRCLPLLMTMAIAGETMLATARQSLEILYSPAHATY